MCKIINPGITKYNYDVDIESPKIWWPFSMGEQPLYNLNVIPLDSDGNIIGDGSEVTFGIRTIEKKPVPGHPSCFYKWLFVINGQEKYLKGANWSPQDCLNGEIESGYIRFLNLAKNANIDILRCWGGGPLESSRFYELCDQLGIMVWQEFPVMGFTEGYNPRLLHLADEMVNLNVRRLRNHPSLIIWCGANEPLLESPLLEKLGKLCLELDGTRPYHRTCPYLGEQHNYLVYWEKAPIERYCEMRVPDFSEFGLASPGNMDVIKNYLPEDEKDGWPIPEDGSFVYHTPTFDKQHLELFRQYAGEYGEVNSMEDLVQWMQYSQGYGLRILIDRHRSNFPKSTGTFYYKFNEVYPACSWSTVDWFGAMKASHYDIQHAYEPIHPCAAFNKIQNWKAGEIFKADLFLATDRIEEFEDIEYHVDLWDSSLKRIFTKVFEIKMEPFKTKKISELEITLPNKEIEPFILTLSYFEENGNQISCSVYYFNYSDKKGCLFNLPKADISFNALDFNKEEKVEIEIFNNSEIPSFYINLTIPGMDENIELNDNYFCLLPSRKKVITVLNRRSKDDSIKDIPEILSLNSWNSNIVEISKDAVKV